MGRREGMKRGRENQERIEEQKEETKERNRTEQLERGTGESTRKEG